MTPESVLIMTLSDLRPQTFTANTPLYTRIFSQLRKLLSCELVALTNCYSSTSRFCISCYSVLFQMLFFKNAVLILQEANTRKALVDPGAEGLNGAQFICLRAAALAALLTRM